MSNTILCWDAETEVWLWQDEANAGDEFETEVTANTSGNGAADDEGMDVDNGDSKVEFPIF